ncbi:MAG: hypothetical protein ABFS56_15745 [Pseudomonadota bacterium]
MFKFFTMAWLLLVLIGSPVLTKATTGGERNIAMLGFSPDSKYFVMVQLGTIDGSGAAIAEIMIVDVATNRCVRGGCQTVSGDGNAPRTEKDVLNEVLKKTWRLRQRLKLTPPHGYFAQGHIFDSTGVYDYIHKNIRVHLRQKVNEEQTKASMQLEINMGDSKKTLDSLDNYRDFVLGYRLEDSLFISPNEKCFAFLVKVHYPSGHYDFIVQTVKF